MSLGFDCNLKPPLYPTSPSPYNNFSREGLLLRGYKQREVVIPTKAHNNSKRGMETSCGEGLGLGFTRPSYKKREKAFVYKYTYSNMRVGLEI